MGRPLSPFWSSKVFWSLKCHDPHHSSSTFIPFTVGWSLMLLSGNEAFQSTWLKWHETASQEAYNTCDIRSIFKVLMSSSVQQRFRQAEFSSVCWVLGSLNSRWPVKWDLDTCTQLPREPSFIQTYLCTLHLLLLSWSSLVRFPSCKARPCPLCISNSLFSSLSLAPSFRAQFLIFLNDLNSWWSFLPL